MKRGVSYFDALTAPLKKLVWFEHSGVEPFVDVRGKFNAAMAELVRPAALSPSGTCPVTLDGE